MASPLRFRDYTAILILTVFSFTMVINFSGNVLNIYDTGQTDSSTLQEIKEKTDGERLNSDGSLRNRTENVDVNGGGFLSPQGFSIIQDTLGSIANIPGVVNTAIVELGLPKSVGLLALIPVAALMFEALSLLFGIRT